MNELGKTCKKNACSMTVIKFHFHEYSESYGCDTPGDNSGAYVPVASMPLLPVISCPSVWIEPVLSDAVVDAIAKEIGKTIASHIETMYPEAAKAVAWKSAALSIEGVVRNAVSAAGKAAEAGQIEKWLEHSKDMRKLNTKIRQNGQYR